LANRPDIITKIKDKTCLLIDVAIPPDKNVIQKEAEKKLRYKNISIEIQRMWNMKCTIMYNKNVPINVRNLYSLPNIMLRVTVKFP
jgi:hypothetical protein